MGSWLNYFLPLQQAADSMQEPELAGPVSEPPKEEILAAETDIPEAPVSLDQEIALGMEVTLQDF